jgi:hypothetical protein
MSLFANPVIIALVIGTVCFITLSYFNPESHDTKGTRDRKNKQQIKTARIKAKEANIIISIIVSLVTWYVVKTNLFGLRVFVPVTTVAIPTIATGLPSAPPAPSAISAPSTHTTMPTIPPVPMSGITPSRLPETHHAPSHIHAPSNIPAQDGGKIFASNHSLSDASPHIIRTGLTLPRDGFKIPSVLIDYQ